jgi:exodeoxyribonuclease-5
MVVDKLQEFMVVYHHHIRSKVELVNKELTIPFGKYRGTPLSEMDRGYLRWMLKTVDGGDAWKGLTAFVTRHRETIEGLFDPRVIAAKVEVDYELSYSQGQAVEAVMETLINGDVPYMRLEGGAGYGKSFVCLDLVRRAMGEGYSVHACATSYVATQVLASKMNRYDIEPRTIAATMKMRPEIDVDTGEEDYLETEDTYSAVHDLLKPQCLLLVDEYSMVHDDTATMMMSAAAEGGGKLLVVGDLAQLPPVKQTTDSVFSRIPHVFTLTEPMRYLPNSDLFRLEQAARENPYAFASLDWSGSTEVVVHPGTPELFRQFKQDYFAAPAEDARMLYFRRRDVIAANETVRDMLFGPEMASGTPVIEDEKLMVTSTTFMPTGVYRRNPITNREEEIVNRWYSGESFLVESVEEYEEAEVPCYRVKFSGRDTPTPVVFGMTASNLVGGSRGSEEFAAKRKVLRDAAIECTDKEARKEAWKAFYQFSNRFLVVSHAYATTVHRAQGASLDRVYFDPRQLQGSSMTAKLLYVAATRAKKAMHFVAGG